MDVTPPEPPALLPGIDVPAVEAWWTGRVAGGAAPLAFARIAGGRSNLTYRVTDAAGRVSVLRRPPAGAVLESAHDVLREARIVGALASGAVPVPVVLGVCDEPTVTGAPFYVMDHVDGAVLHDDAAMLAGFAERDRPTVARSMIDGLAALHDLDVDAAGLGDLGRREGYVARQLDRWHRQWEASRTREVPLIDEVHARLSAAVPEQQRVSIVHGDYRLGNVILGPDGALRAVLDWELCTLGDPLADVGYTLAWWVGADEAATHPLGRGPSSVPGVPGRDVLLQRYAGATGLDVSRIDFYVAFALWKIACIMEGVRERDLRTRPDEAPPETQVPALVESALRALGG
ncbi:phosphotransferase family protein [Patulibacter sp.]|uniref:phosphotransferase family protein n=1 Tax=Patulibacter sp. TaxID=1912859 RepID=UPI0027282802|nr:phosphotransferase family protein [Patulibacter sp.]MDO9407410.1 phosphotransferase family protein [Patulibacter sp.]